MSLKIGYKVVRRRWDEFTSCTVGKKFRLKYAVGQITRPKNGMGSLAVFSEPVDAMRFVGLSKFKKHRPRNRNYWTRIFLCVYDDNPKGSLFNGRSRRNGIHGWVPNGTKFAKSVVLVQDLTDDLTA